MVARSLIGGGRLLRVSVVARMLDVHEATIRRYVASGALAAVRIGPRGIRIPVEAVESLLVPGGAQ